MSDLDDLYGTPPEPPPKPARSRKRKRGEPPPGDYPDWYTPSNERQTANRRVLRGLHPLGLNLAPLPTSCGSCRHLTRRRLAKTYIKCAVGPQSGGPGTDIRAKWRGCSRWELAEGKRLTCIECGGELERIDEHVPPPFALACRECGGMF